MAGVEYGLILGGKVVARNRRLVGEQKTEAVAYRVMTGVTVSELEHWSPKAVCYRIGDEIRVEVGVKAFTLRGRRTYRLVIEQRGDDGF